MTQAPDRGDLVYLTFNPQSGHEQAGWPGIVLSPRNFNEVTQMAVICPITNTVKGWPFEVELPTGLVFQGAILTDQVKSLNWKARKVKIKGQAPSEVVTDCLDKIHTFL